MFEKILEAYREGDNNLFEARVRNWLSEELPCPFNTDSPEYVLYSKAVFAYRRWRKNGISSRYAKVQMVEYVREIAKLQDKKDIIPELAEKVPDAVKEIKLEEPVHMTGVIPEKGHFFKKKVKNNESK